MDLKKIILASTAILLFGLWYVNHPSAIETKIPDFSYKYIVKTMKQGSYNSTPLIFALHGNGDSIKNFNSSLFHDLKINAVVIFIQGPLEYLRGHAWPTSGEELVLYGDALAYVIKELSNDYYSTEKPIVIGFSGGGFMAYYLAAKHPEMFSHIIPISGGLGIGIDNDLEIEELKITALHGKKDRLINFSWGTSAASTFSNAGYNIEFIELPGEHLSVFTDGHSIFKKLIEDSCRF